MAESYRVISGDANEVERQFKIMAAKSQEGKWPTERPILMSSAGITNLKGAGVVVLHVIVESET